MGRVEEWIILERLWVTVPFFFFFWYLWSIFNDPVTVGLIQMASVSFYWRLRQIWEVILKGIGEEKKKGKDPVNYFLLWGFPELLSFSTLVKAVSVSVWCLWRWSHGKRVRCVGNSMAHGLSTSHLGCVCRARGCWRNGGREKQKGFMKLKIKTICES